MENVYHREQYLKVKYFFTIIFLAIMHIFYNHVDDNFG